MPAFSHRINKALAERESAGLTRTITPCDGGNTSTIRIGGRNLLNFSNNDYLGLANDPELNKAFQQGIELYGSGSSASPMVTGFSRAHQLLENALCEWLGFERAVLFSSGFAANQALLMALLQKDDLLIQDKLNHASLMEAGMLSPATMKRFRHNDVEHLSRLMTKQPIPDTMVVTEGVFSMDGDQAPLANIRTALQDKALFVVDDAHGIGVLGKRGGGSCEQCGVSPDVLVVTFGKAFGLSGAAILCNQQMGAYLTQFARHHVYSTAFPPAQAYALKHAISMIQTQGWRRERLSEHNEVYRRQLKSLPGYVETKTPIKPFIVGDANAAVSMADKLRQHGIHLTAIRPPTVPSGSARLRITLTAGHNEKQIETLCQALIHVVKECQ